MFVKPRATTRLLSSPSTSLRDGETRSQRWQLESLLRANGNCGSLPGETSTATRAETGEGLSRWQGPQSHRCGEPGSQQRVSYEVLDSVWPPNFWKSSGLLLPYSMVSSIQSAEVSGSLCLPLFRAIANKIKSQTYVASAVTCHCPGVLCVLPPCMLQAAWKRHHHHAIVQMGKQKLGGLTQLAQISAVGGICVESGLNPGFSNSGVQAPSMQLHRRFLLNYAGPRPLLETVSSLSLGPSF